MSNTKNNSGHIVPIVKKGRAANFTKITTDLPGLENQQIIKGRPLKIREGSVHVKR